MPLSPHHRRTLTPGTLSLANADQTLTEVDTRLTKVDKGCQNLTPSTPTPTPDPSKTATAPAIPPPPASTLAVNLSDTPRTTLNKSEQT